ncbi:helix-turn-helix domain-containing protein [Vibrio sp. PP-XX7]
MDLSTNKVVAIFKIKNADKLSTEVFQKIIDIIEHFDKHLLVGVLSFIHHEIVILKNVKVSTYKDSPEITWFKRLVDRIEEYENVHVRLAIGGIFDGVCGIDKSYKTARIALENHSDSRKKIIFYGQDPIKYLISELANADWKLEQFRQPLSAIEKNDVNLSLLNTLKVYFDQNCDQTSTCESLRIHRNTLRYRLSSNRRDDITKNQ